MNTKKLFSLEGKKGFITGGAQGIGKTIAVPTPRLGTDVAIVDLNYEKAKEIGGEIARETGQKVLAYECDVADPASVETDDRKL